MQEDRTSGRWPRVCAVVLAGCVLAVAAVSSLGGSDHSFQAPSLGLPTLISKGAFQSSRRSGLQAAEYTDQPRLSFDERLSPADERDLEHLARLKAQLQQLGGVAARHGAEGEKQTAITPSHSSPSATEPLHAVTKDDEVQEQKIVREVSISSVTSLTLFNSILVIHWHSCNDCPTAGVTGSKD